MRFSVGGSGRGGGEEGERRRRGRGGGEEGEGRRQVTSLLEDK